MSELFDQPITGPSREEALHDPVKAPRLARRTIELRDGHEVGLSVSGRGVPLVVIHGFTAEGFLYAQTLNRLVKKGFKVVAIDMAHHGSTQGLPMGGGDMYAYAHLLARTIDELGIRRAVFAGHSMGGRCVTNYAAMHPERTIALMPIDAIIGDTWDTIVRVMRFAPWLLPVFGTSLVVDSLSTVPLFTDPEQSAKFMRLARPTFGGHALRPWRLLGPAVSILRSADSTEILETIAQNLVPTFVIHGERDAVVPVCTADHAARRSGGMLIRVHRAGHSWPLKDPETLPAIVEELLEGQLGVAIRNALTGAGAGTVEDIEDQLYEPDAPILDLTPELRWTPVGEEHRRPRYRWTVSQPR